MRVIGITGNTGSGKSYICEILKNSGAYVINADEYAHEAILKKNPAYAEITAYFGNSILDANGEINRGKLGEIVFKDKKKLDYLSKIVHRFVILKTQKTIEQIKNECSLLIIDAPLLIEAGMHKICDEVWVVYANNETRLKRIMERDSLTHEKALLRMESQTPFEALAAHATKIIYNESEHNDLLEQVKDVLCY